MAAPQFGMPLPPPAPPSAPPVNVGYVTGWSVYGFAAIIIVLFAVFKTFKENGKQGGGGGAKEVPVKEAAPAAGA